MFGLRSVPPDDADLDGILDALDWVAPGFEIVQSHMPDWKFDAPQTVANAGLHARLLAGPRVPVVDLASDGRRVTTRCCRRWRSSFVDWIGSAYRSR